MMHSCDGKKLCCGASLLALGAVAGLAAGLFLKSERGEELTDEARKRLRLLKRDLEKKVKGAKRLSRDTYEDLVDNFIDKYRDTKELAEEQLEKVKTRLLDQWDDLRTQMEEDAEKNKDQDAD